MEPIPIEDYLVVETSDFAFSNADGAVTVADGEEQLLLEYEPATDNRTVNLHALGASDSAGVSYRVYYGVDIAFTMESPPGTIMNPYSYTLNLGGPLSTNDTFQFTCLNESGGSTDQAARAHIEVV